MVVNVSDQNLCKKSDFMFQVFLACDCLFLSFPSAVITISIPYIWKIWGMVGQIVHNLHDHVIPIE